MSADLVATAVPVPWTDASCPSPATLFYGRIWDFPLFQVAWASCLWEYPPMSTTITPRQEGKLKMPPSGLILLPPPGFLSFCFFLCRSWYGHPPGGPLTSPRGRCWALRMLRDTLPLPPRAPSPDGFHSGGHCCLAFVVVTGLCSPKSTVLVCSLPSHSFHISKQNPSYTSPREHSSAFVFIWEGPMPSSTHKREMTPCLWIL